MKKALIQNSSISVTLACLLWALAVFRSHAEFTFSSGSDGSYGAMNINSNTTLVLPVDGKFNCTTITIASNATLKFTPNALNTPVYLLATGDVIVNGTIDINGSAATSVFGGVGGPGGFSGGNPASAGLPASDGHGPGAGRTGPGNGSNCVGSAGYAVAGATFYTTTNNGAVYGSALLLPLVGGSGGGGTTGGGGSGGGGAVLLASNTRIDIAGSILACGPSIYSSGPELGLGSGGAIRLVSPIISGTGTLNVSGGANTYALFSSCAGGYGRIRIDCVDRHSLALTYAPAAATSIGANMVTFIPNTPRLDITQVGTNSIPVGTGTSVFFMLPWDADTNQTVTVQATNFGRVVPVRVALTPDNGPGSYYDSQVDNSTSGSASVTVPVVVPVNVRVQVSAWTR